MNRREFVASSLALAGCGCLASCAGQTVPRRATGPVEVGTPADYRTEGMTARWAESYGFYVVREAGKIYAVSSTCTHKRCFVSPEDDKRIELACDCHGSRFTKIGVVLKGPARTSLPHFGIKLDVSDRIVVDPSRRFEQAEWDQPGAYVGVGSSAG